MRLDFVGCEPRPPLAWTTISSGIVSRSSNSNAFVEGRRRLHLQQNSHTNKTIDSINNSTTMIARMTFVVVSESNMP
jgi:hypothetical protein